MFFQTSEPLVATDTDTSRDVYLRENGVTSLLSQGAINGNGVFDASFRGASADGSRVFFQTSEPLVATDTDTSRDIYLRENGVTSHLSQGSINGNGAFNATFSGASTDGSRVFLETDEPLAATDTDASTDVYVYYQPAAQSGGGGGGGGTLVPTLLLFLLLAALGRRAQKRQPSSY